MDRKLLFLVNPISGTKKKQGLVQLIKGATTKAGFSGLFIDTRQDGNYNFLPDLIEKEKITDVIVCGGDGSVSQVCSSLIGISVNIGIIPMGSGNGLALAAKIPTNPASALKVIFDGKASLVDGFYINNRFSCMMCGIGNDAKIAHDFSNEKKRGLKTYLRLSALHYFKSKAYSFTITVNNHSFHTDAYFIVIANSNQFGNHVTIAPAARLNDSLLDIVIVKKMNKIVLPFELLKQIVGRNKMEKSGSFRHSKNISYFQTSELFIDNKQNAPVHIDGEPTYLTGSIHVRIIPNAFRLLQPQ